MAWRGALMAGRCMAAQDTIHISQKTPAMAGVLEAAANPGYVDADHTTPFAFISRNTADT